MGGLSKSELQRLKEQFNPPRSQIILPHSQACSRVKQRSLVVMFGWMSSSIRAVAKHSPPYVKLGIPVLCIAPTLFHVWSSRLGSRLTRSVAETIGNCLDSPVSMVLHTFSGATGVCLPSIASDFESGQSLLTEKLRPSGSVFDSGPPLFTHEFGMAVVKQAYQQGRDITYPFYLAAVSGGLLTVGHRMRTEVEMSLRSPVLNVPQLYLYSEIDQVVTPSHVQKIIREQKALGREVFSHCFKDSQHVRHYIGDPVTYEYHIYSLLKICHII